MDHDITPIASEAESNDAMDRRDFLVGLKKWSKIVIGGVLFGSVVLTTPGDAEAAGYGWVNNGRSWVNRYGGGGWANHHGGSVWANGGRTWANGGGSWINRRGGWGNHGGSWANRGGAWVNRW